MGSVLLTTLTEQIQTHNEQNEALDYTAEVTPGEQTKTNISTGVPVHTPTHSQTQKSVDSVKDIAKGQREHTEVDIPPVSVAETQVSDNVSVLQIPVEAQAINNPESVPQGEAEVPDLRTESKVATLVTIIAGGAIVSVISGLLGNEKAKLTHNIFFEIFTALNYLSLVSGICLFLLIFTRPSIPGFVKIIKFTKWFALALMTYSLGCGTCILLPHLAVVLLILVVPLVVALLIVTLSFGPRN